MSVDQEASDADRFIEYLSTSIAMGDAHLASKNGTCPSAPSAWGWKITGTLHGEATCAQGAKIGWIVGKEIYLDMKAALSVIKTFSTRLGNHLGSSERAIKKALGEAGMLSKDGEGRYNRKVTVEGRRVSAVCIPANLVMDIEKIEREPTEDNETLEEIEGEPSADDETPEYNSPF